MKKLSELRNQSILEHFYEIRGRKYKEEDSLNINDIVRELLQLSAPQFYVEPATAKRIVSLMHRGAGKAMTYGSKQQMYGEIYRRFLQAVGNQEKPDYSVIDDILREPAPSYYLEPVTVRTIIYSTIRAGRAKRKHMA